MNPVYLVVWEHIRDIQILVKRILNVIECDMSEVNSVWAREVTPLQYTRSVGMDIYAREPENPFRDARIKRSPLFAELKKAGAAPVSEGGN
jgi:hypothetical protein